MKIIKYIFLLAFLVAIAVTVFVATQDGRYNITKEETINLQPSVVYNYINDYNNWKYIGILTDNDTTAVYSYTDKTSGKGALATWKVKGTQGKIQTLKAAENDSIIQKAVVNGQESDIKWLFKKAGDKTKISVQVQGQLTFMDKAYALFNNNVYDRLDEVVTKGLQNLDAFLVKELTTYTTQVSNVVNKKPVFYLKQTVTDSTPEAYNTIQAVVSKLNTFVKTNKIPTNGAPFTIYRYNGTLKKSPVFSVCIPIKEEIVTALGSEFEGGKLNGFNALKLTLKGNYTHSKKAWGTAKDYILKNSLPENIDGEYLEVYTKGPGQTKRPSKYVTDYYIPVGPRTGNLADTLSVLVPGVIPAPAVIDRPATDSRVVKPTTTTAPRTTAKPATITGTGTKPAVSITTPKNTGSTPKSNTTTTRSNTVKPSEKPKTTSTATGTKPATGTTTTKTTQQTTTTKPAAKPAQKTTAKPTRTLPDEFN